MNTVNIVKPMSESDNLVGRFYVIEAFPYPQFVMDENGLTKCFDNYQDAMQEADDCQESYIIQL